MYGGNYGAHRVGVGTGIEFFEREAIKRLKLGRNLNILAVGILTLSTMVHANVIINGEPTILNKIALAVNIVIATANTFVICRNQKELNNIKKRAKRKSKKTKIITIQ